MILLKLYYVIIFLTMSCHALNIGNIVASISDKVTYLKNFIESRKAMPTLEADFLTFNAALLDFLSRNDDTYNIEDSYLNTSQLIYKYGYPFEEHRVVTEDGYILTLHRIPSNGPVVFLNHGFLASSVNWVTSGPKSSTAFYLASRGYDVWMGNARGNRYSRKNVYISPEDQKRLYDFTFQEIGYYDLPASFNYILNKTRQQKLNYVGHSEGTTVFFVLCSLRPEFNDKINVMVALAPVTYFSHAFSPALRLGFKINVAQILKALGYYEILPNSDLLYVFCNNNNVFKFICINMMNLGFGFDRGMLNFTSIPVITNHAANGGSSKTIEHYSQLLYSGKFRQYDYGMEGNLRRYGSKAPPDYPLHKVTAPVALSYSQSDYVSNLIDVLQLRENLPNVVGFFEAVAYNHIDYLYSSDVNQVINKRIVRFIRGLSTH